METAISILGLNSILELYRDNGQKKETTVA